MMYLLDFRDANQGGAVVPGRIIRRQPLSGRLGTENDLRAESSITFLLHGYNISRPAGQDSLLRLAERLPSLSQGGVVAVLWPGDHWTRAMSYPFEGRDADDSAAELFRYIELVITRSTPLSFVSHSLGARVAMETVKKLIGKGYSVRQVCLMAPAIDDSSLADPAVYRPAVGTTERVAVLASRKDTVLKLAYPAGDILQAFALFWKEKIDLALGYHGPRNSRQHAIPADRVYSEQIADGREANHGHYIPGDHSTPVQEMTNQRSAAKFADEVLQGVTRPRYS